MGLAIACMMCELLLSPKGINMPDIDPQILSNIQNTQSQDRLGNVLQHQMNGLGSPVNEKLRFV